MAEKENDAPKGMTSTAEGVQTNHEVGKQTDDQFFHGDRERPEDKPAPASHATKGMTSLGYTEASRIEDTAKFQEAERKAAEKAAAKEKDD